MGLRLGLGLRESERESWKGRLALFHRLGGDANAFIFGDNWKPLEGYWDVTVKWVSEHTGMQRHAETCSDVPRRFNLTFEIGSTVFLLSFFFWPTHTAFGNRYRYIYRVRDTHRLRDTYRKRARDTVADTAVIAKQCPVSSLHLSLSLDRHMTSIEKSAMVWHDYQGSKG